MVDLEDWQVLLGLFPADWRELGRSSGAVRRLRGFPSLDALLRTLLLHVGCGRSLRETAVQAKLAGLAAVSDVTLLNRLRDAENWLRELCQSLWKENGVQLDTGLEGRPIRLLDATVVREPGKTGSQWRIHYSLRLPTLECDSQAEVCVRLNPRGVSLGDAEDKPFRLLSSLSALKQAGDVGDWPVLVRFGARRIAGRVCAIRKSQDAIDRAQRRLDRKRQRGQNVVPATRKYAEYVLVFTTLPGTEASVEQVLEIYRLRWQVELTFKRLKSIAQLGHVPKHDPQSSRAWLYGKLLVALLSEKLARVGKSISPWGYLLPPPNSRSLA